MSRALWSGHISFGLVSVPIKMFTATTPRDLQFNQIDKVTGSRVKMRRVAETDGHEVPYEDIIKGYEYTSDRFILIDPTELEGLAPDQANAIDIEEFVDLDAIDPVLLDKAYYVAPETNGAKPYALLREAMVRTRKVAVGRMVMRSKEHVVVLRPVGDHSLAVTTCFLDDEVVPETDLSIKPSEVTEAEVDLAVRLIGSLTSERFDLTQYRDTYRDKVMALIEAKAAGQEWTAPEASLRPAPTDLLAALTASVQAAVVAKAEADARVVEG